MVDRPDLIDKEVPRFIDEVRGTVPQPTDYGSTITEMVIPPATGETRATGSHLVLSRDRYAVPLPPRCSRC